LPDERPPLGAVGYLRAETMPTGDILENHALSDTYKFTVGSEDSAQDQRIVNGRTNEHKVCAVRHVGMH
jgi:hypothetical protein